METLFKAGYSDFAENKVMIESNPGMTIEDIMACIAEANQANGLDLENVQANSSDEEALALAAEEHQEEAAKPTKKKLPKMSKKAKESNQKKSSESLKPKKLLEMPI